METSLKQYWTEVLEIPGAPLILWITALIIGIWVAYYFGKLFRDMALGGSSDPTSYISDFERLREEGKLDDEEYSRKNDVEFESFSRLSFSQTPDPTIRLKIRCANC